MENVSLVDGHIDNGMTDEDIIKALECCAEVDECEECPLCEGCNRKVFKNALDLINHQKEEIERLQKEFDIMRFTTAKRWVKEAKSEAIKEFAERLKIFVIPQKADGYTREIVLKSNIDSLVKEMTESK